MTMKDVGVMMNDDRSQDNSVLKQQECSWCWEERAVLMRDGEAFCEDCYHESIILIEAIDRLTQDLKQTLEPPLKRWIEKHLTAGVDEGHLEETLGDYGMELTNARAFFKDTS